MIQELKLDHVGIYCPLEAGRGKSTEEQVQHGTVSSGKDWLAGWLSAWASLGLSSFQTPRRYTPRTLWYTHKHKAAHGMLGWKEQNRTTPVSISTLVK